MDWRPGKGVVVATGSLFSSNMYICKPMELSKIVIHSTEGQPQITVQPILKTSMVPVYTSMQILFAIYAILFLTYEIFIAYVRNK